MEKEALLAELSGWRECLDATPLQAAPAQVLEANAHQKDVVQTGSHDPLPIYDAIVIPGPIATHEAHPVAAVTYSTQADSTMNAMPDAHLLDNYTFQTSAVMPADEPNFNSLPRTSQFTLTQVGTRDEALQHALWPAPQDSHIQQPLWTQQAYQEFPLDFQRPQFPGQGYDLNTG